MSDVSLFRLYVLRALYALVTVGLAAVIWPDIIHREQTWSHAQSAVICMLAAFSLLSALGIRYPLAMLPILLWELLWKTLWLVLVPLPQWWSGNYDAAMTPRVLEISLVILVYLAIPWRHVHARYIKAASDRWQ